MCPVRQTGALYGLQAVPEGAGLTLGPSRRHAGVPGARGSGSQAHSGVHRACLCCEVSAVRGLDRREHENEASMYVYEVLPLRARDCVTMKHGYVSLLGT